MSEQWRDLTGDTGPAKLHQRHQERQMKVRLVRGVVTPLSLVLIAVFASAQDPSPSALPHKTIAASYGKRPLSIEPNQGQTDARVQFVSRGEGYTIFLSPTSATFALRRNVNGATSTESAVVRMDLLGANAKTAMQAQNRLPGVTNYLMGGTLRKWPTNCPLTGRPVLRMSIQGSTWSTTAHRASSNMTL
jgi:hypothetical protein